MILPFGITGSTQLWNLDNPSSRNYGINTRSRVPKSPDLFWTEVQGWYNPTTFSMTEVHWIRSEPKSKDDTILPHSRWPKSPDHFWTYVPGWYNPSSFSKTEVSGSLLGKCPGMIQSHCNITTPPFGEGLFEPHQACLKSVWTLLGTKVPSTHILNHHHLHLQYVNTEISPFVSPVCKY